LLVLLAPLLVWVICRNESVKVYAASIDIRVVKKLFSLLGVCKSKSR